MILICILINMRGTKKNLKDIDYINKVLVFS